MSRYKKQNQRHFDTLCYSVQVTQPATLCGPSVGRACGNTEHKSVKPPCALHAFSDPWLNQSVSIQWNLWLPFVKLAKFVPQGDTLKGTLKSALRCAPRWLQLDFRVEGRIESKRFTEKRSATSYSVSVRSDQTLGEIV